MWTAIEISVCLEGMARERKRADPDDQLRRRGYLREGERDERALKAIHASDEPCGKYAERIDGHRRGTLRRPPKSGVCSQAVDLNSFSFIREMRGKIR